MAREFSLRIARCGTMFLSVTDHRWEYAKSVEAYEPHTHIYIYIYIYVHMYIYVHFRILNAAFHLPASRNLHVPFNLNAPRCPRLAYQVLVTRYLRAGCKLH